MNPDIKAINDKIEHVGENPKLEYCITPNFANNSNIIITIAEPTIVVKIPMINPNHILL